ILFGVIGLVGSGSVASSSGERSRTEAITTLQAAKIPAPVISRLTSFEHLTAADTAGLTSRQRATVRNTHLTLTASAAGTDIGTGIAAGFSIFIIVGSVVGGLLGWLLIMKKR